MWLFKKKIIITCNYGDTGGESRNLLGQGVQCYMGEFGSSKAVFSVLSQMVNGICRSYTCHSKKLVFIILKKKKKKTFLFLFTYLFFYNLIIRVV